MGPENQNLPGSEPPSGTVRLEGAGPQPAGQCLLTEEKGPQPQRVGSENRPRVPKKGPGSQGGRAPGSASSLCEALPRPPGLHRGAPRAAAGPPSPLQRSSPPTIPTVTVSISAFVNLWENREPLLWLKIE